MDLVRSIAGVAAGKVEQVVGAVDAAEDQRPSTDRCTVEGEVGNVEVESESEDDEVGGESADGNEDEDEVGSRSEDERIHPDGVAVVGMSDQHPHANV